jgi:hypothetical protein
MMLSCSSLVLFICMDDIFRISSIFCVSISFSCLISLNFRTIIVLSFVLSRFSFSPGLLERSCLANLDLLSDGSIFGCFYAVSVTNMLKLGMLFWPLKPLDSPLHFYLRLCSKSLSLLINSSIVFKLIVVLKCSSSYSPRLVLETLHSSSLALDFLNDSNCSTFSGEYLSGKTSIFFSVKMLILLYLAVLAIFKTSLTNLNSWRGDMKWMEPGRHYLIIWE